MRQQLEAVKKTYPDYTMEIIRQFEDGETVISEFIMRETHKGEFLGITPTNKVIEMTGAVNTFDAFWTNGLIKPV